MLDADPVLQGIAHRNFERIQGSMDRLLDRKAVQIEGAQFRFRTRRGVTGDEQALGLVLMGRDERGEWLPCHA